MRRVFALFAATAVLFSCSPEAGKKSASESGPFDFEDEILEEEVVPEDIDSWQAVPLQGSVTKVQPMTGIVMWSDSEYGTDDIQLEFSYMLYNDVCKKKDVFDWTPMENLLDEIASRGHQAVVRFRYTYPGQDCAVPDYIKKESDYEQKWYKAEGKRTEYPDWRCAELRRFHKEFHRRFAERYDADPRLAFLQTGFGHWAEYHVYDGKFIEGQTFPTKAFQAEFFRGMAEWFKQTTWSISIDAADPTYGPFEDDPSLLKIPFGNFDDSFMCEDHDGYNYESWAYFGQNRYKRAPLGGEFSYYSSSDQKHCLDTKGMHGRIFEDEVAKFHMTFIIGADQPRYQSWSRIREAALSMGYRFRITDFRIKGDVAAVRVANVGVAPIYRDAFVAVDGVRSAWSLKKLMPGAERWLLVKVPGLSATSAPSIECDHLVKGQKIGFEADLNH